jgi:hypothetical protein
MAQEIKFYQIYYRDLQLSHLYPFAIPYFNDKLTPFFENAVIKKLVLEADCDKISVTSWALRSKMRLNIRKLTREVLEEDYDVLSFSRSSKFHKMLAGAEVWHPGFTELLTKIMVKAVNIIPKEPKYPVYQNAFIAKSQIYKKYVTEFLIPCMDVMVNDAEINKLCWQNANYTKLKREPLTDKAKIDLGVGYYPMHPFICERFFSQWLETQNLKVEYL